MDNLTFNTTLYGEVSMLPFPPLAGARETLAFYTDVLANYTNTSEQRAQLRAIPRQSFQYSFNVKYERMQRVFNSISMNIRERWLVPLWFEAQQCATTVGQTVFVLDTLYHDWRTGMYALVYDGFANWELLAVSALTSTQITCDATALSGAVYVVPVRIGYISGQGASVPSGSNNQAKLTFNIDDVLTGLTDTVTQYNGLDLYTTPFLMDGTSVTAKWNVQDDQLDYNFGNVDHSTPWARGQYSRNYMWDGNTAQELRSLRNYFYRRAGKWRSFMSPTFESNLRKASTGALTTTFKFYDDGFVELLGGVRNTLGFQMLDGSWQIRAATAPTALGDNMAQITLDTSLAVDASQVQLVSFVAENRLDTDQLEIQLSNGGYFSASASVMEIAP